jgi:NADPH:quinone reductase
VTAAAGGLGTLFVQAARNVGAVAVGVAGGPEKVERVRAAGADIAVHYLEPDWPDRVRDALGDRSVSVVLDGVGGDAGHAAMDLLGAAVRHVLFGWSAGEPTRVTTEDLLGRGLTVTAIGPRILPRIRELETRSLQEATAGRLVPAVQHFPLAQAADAHRALESPRHHRQGRADPGAARLTARSVTPYGRGWARREGVRRAAWGTRAARARP